MPKKKEHTVTIELDATKPRPLTRAQKAKLAALGRMPDALIDYSDIPRSTPSFWENAVRGGLYRPVKRQLSIRIDADVLAWLRSKGNGYHGRLNEILRSAMLKELKSRS
jgi:uncharacterized protein (DUF4415 family)